MALVTLTSFRDIIQAELARSRLESLSIPAVIADQHTVGVQWLYSRAIGGVKVQVDEADLAQAREALREDLSDELEDVPEAQGDADIGDRCPACGSSRVRPSRVQRNAALLSLATGLPLITSLGRWVCETCGHAWKHLPADAEDLSAVTLEAERQVHEPQDYSAMRTIVAVAVVAAILYYAIRLLKA